MLFFFQTVLFAGYALRASTSTCSQRTRTLVHVGLLAAAIVMLPITPSETWKR